MTSHLEKFNIVLWGIEDYLFDIIEYLVDNNNFIIKKFENSLLVNLSTENGYNFSKTLLDLNKQFQEYYHQLLIFNMDLPEVNDYIPFTKESFPENNREFLIYIKSKTKEIKNKFYGVQVNINLLKNKILILKRYRGIIEKIRPLVEELAKHSYKDYDVFFIDKTSFKLDTIIEKIKDSCSDEIEIYEEPIDDRITALIILDQDLSKIHDFFKEERIGSAMEVPEDYEDMSVNKAVLEIHEHLDTISSSLNPYYKQLNSLSIEYKGFLNVIIPEIEKRIAILEKINGNIYISNFVFFLTGILLTSDIESFKAKINEEYMSKINLKVEPISITEN